jgi:Putative Actinobacterial Holin-X, holin superfamily III
MVSHQEPPEAGDLRERPLPELFRQLTQETTTLLRQEVELAKAELAEKGRQAGKGAGLFGGAGVVGLGAVGALTACFILALDTVMPAWLAALIVAVVYGAVAAILALRGRSKLQQAAPPVPEQTVETLKEDVRWAKNQTPSAKR